MSVIVTDENGSIWLLCKGAESSLVPLMRPGSYTEEAARHIHDFSSRGLRTLVVGCRQITEPELKFGKHQLLEARSSLDLCSREELLNAVFSSLEGDLQLLGITAVEDQLQEFVPETLATLYAAGIKVWVLTGDKVETAKSIAYSCGHFKPSTEIIPLTGYVSLEDCLQQLCYYGQKVRERKSTNYGLVIDGHSLGYILPHDPQTLLEVSLNSSAVICCRLSPKQKAQYFRQLFDTIIGGTLKKQYTEGCTTEDGIKCRKYHGKYINTNNCNIVSLVKHSAAKPITLAIGDGANDVSMIQEAHIGIGIMGKEGQQAVHCSDFAFAQFHCLTKALLVHGHWYYLRAANLVLYFFYKNIVFITPQVYFAFGMSPQVFYSSLYLLLYNTLFTAAPIIVYSLLEQDYSSRTLLNYPELYRCYRKNTLMSWKNFLHWMLYGVWHSAVIYFVPYLASSMTDSGSNIDLVTFGTLVLHSAVVVVNLKLLIHSQYWTHWFILSIIGSIVGFIGFSFFYTYFFLFITIQQLDFELMYMVYSNLYTSPWFWIVTVLSVFVSLIPDSITYIIKKWDDGFFPSKDLSNPGIIDSN